MDETTMTFPSFRPLTNIGFWVALCLLAALLPGCTSTGEKAVTAETAMVRIEPEEWPALVDDLDMDSLRRSIRGSLKYYRTVPGDRMFRYGQDLYSADYLAASLAALLHRLERSDDYGDFVEFIRRNYLMYASVGSSNNDGVLFTGYYEPLVEADRQPSPEYSVPLYSPPDDRLKVMIGEFLPESGVKYALGRLSGDTVVPYHTHEEINTGALKGRNLEIAYAADRVDVFFLQIQGSGVLRFPDGSLMRVGYAASNGHPYKSIGKLMIDEGLIAREDMSMFAIKEYLENHPEELDRILHANPSYVFFRTLDTGPVGNIGVVLTPGRSIATDDELFPKGALAYVQSYKPILDMSGNPVEWTAYGRFACNQDTGGAIVGPGRADMFWGSGRYAEVAAGLSRHWGQLYFPVMKQGTQP
jgi:membrane-bound lytic murein transglycosylase A